MNIKHLLRGDWDLLPHIDCYGCVNEVSNVFGKADVDISHRKLKKQYIRSIFNDDYTPEDEAWAVIKYIGRSKLIQKMFIKCVNRIHPDSSTIWEIIYNAESLAVRYIKKRIIHPFGMIEDIYYGCESSSEKLVRTIKTFGKIVVLNKKLKKIVNIPMEPEYAISNIYTLLIHNVSCDYISKCEHFPLHIFILHRRNKVKFSVPKLSEKLYSVLSLITGVFVSKNLSRLLLYY